MFEKIRERINAILTKWRSLPKPQKIVIMGAVLGALLSAFLLLLWAQKPQYVPLFTNLDPKDASAIVKQL